MYHYDVQTAMEELKEESLLPNPVHVRDMLFRNHPQGGTAVELNKELQEYFKHFDAARRAAERILSELAAIPDLGD